MSNDKAAPRKKRTGAGRPAQARKTPVDVVRLAAFETMMAINSDDGYANLVLPKIIAAHQLDTQQAGRCTELVAGTSRFAGTYDLIIERAGGRKIASLQPAVVQLLRLVAHELLSMQIPSHAAVGESVSLARATVGERVTGLVNAVGRKIAAKTLDEWVEQLSASKPDAEQLALQTHHPRWISDVYRGLLGEEAKAGLEANNEPPKPTLVIRPGLVDRADFLASHPDLQPGQWSEFAVTGLSGNPADLAEVAAGQLGVQDEGSQLVAAALAQVDAPAAPWLDLCAGPGGKSALLTGLARVQGSMLVASEAQPHRAELVANALRAYPDGWQVITADGRQPAWQPRSFARVLADVPCTGLGALRRRPEARWRKSAKDLDDLVPLQRELLTTAIESTMDGGAVAYVTCSPHKAETTGVLNAVLAEHPEAQLIEARPHFAGMPGSAHPEDERLVQLWPHRHGTDAMFLALLRVERR